MALGIITILTVVGLLAALGDFQPQPVRELNQDPYSTPPKKAASRVCPGAPKRPFNSFDMDKKVVIQLKIIFTELNVLLVYRTQDSKNLCLIH